MTDSYRARIRHVRITRVHELVLIKVMESSDMGQGWIADAMLKGEGNGMHCLYDTSSTLYVACVCASKVPGINDKMHNRYSTECCECAFTHLRTPITIQAWECSAHLTLLYCIIH